MLLVSIMAPSNDLQLFKNVDVLFLGLHFFIPEFSVGNRVLFCMFIEAILFLAVYGFAAVNLKIVFLPLLAFEIIVLIDNFRYLLVKVFTVFNVVYTEILSITIVYLLSYLMLQSFNNYLYGLNPT